MNYSESGVEDGAKIGASAAGSEGRFTRQRRGCLTCRQRKKKCEQAYPVCSPCSRLNLVCRWEGPRDLQAESSSGFPRQRHQMTRKSTKAKTSNSSGPQGPDLRQLGVYHTLSHAPSVGSEDITTSRRMMLRYYTATLVFMLTNNTQNNCFLSVLLPMAFECPTLMYALAASSSAHLALHNEDFRVTALQHSGVALAELKKSMSRRELGPEMRLAVTLVLCSMESISCGTDNWIHHLAGAAATLQDTRWDQVPGAASSSSEDKGPVTDPKAALLRYYEGRWLLRNFAYHDIIMSVSLDRRPFISGDYWVSEDGDVADPYFGFAARIIYLIGEISDLKADFADALSEDPTTPTLESSLSAQFSQRAQSIETQLREWTCPAEADDLDDTSLILLAEAYRHGALIHLYRVLRQYIPSHSDALKRKLLASVTAICNASSAMSRGCFAETSMIFPLFMAGGEAETVEHIEIIRDGLTSLNDQRRFLNVVACVNTLDEVWRLSATGTRRSDSSRVDWLDITGSRGWKIALF